MKKGCFHCLLLLIVWHSATAQVNPIFKTYSYQQGLNSYHIYKTIQDKYGFLWIATQDGIYRFNGHSFELIKNNTGSANNTMGNVFIDLAKKGDNHIIAADYFYGADIINVKNWRVDYLRSAINSNAANQLNYSIEKIFADADENIWVSGIGYFAVKKNGDTSFKVINNLPGFKQELKINCITAINKETVAISIETFGLLYFNTKTLQQEAVQQGIAPNDIYVSNDTVYMTANNIINKAVYTNKKLQTIHQATINGLKEKVTNSLVYDKRNGVWIGTNNGLLYYNLQTRQEVIYNASKTMPHWLNDNMINHLMIDNQDNLWISGYNVLQMLSLKENGFRAYSGNEPGNDLMNHIYTITPFASNKLFCTGTDGLYIVNTENNNVKKIPASSNFGIIHHIEKVSDNLWIVSSDKGMLLYDGITNTLSKDKLLNMFPEWAPFKNNYFNTSIKAGSSYYWASEEEEGVLKWDIEGHTIKQFKAGTVSTAGLTENHIRNIKKDRDGFLWILSDVTLSKFDATKDTIADVLFVNSQKDIPAASLYFDMYDDGNNYWFASYGGGVCGYNRKTKTWDFINEKNGLCNNSVYGILPETDSIFWVSTNMGLSRVNAISKNCSNYYYEDGLQDNSFDEKGALNYDGKLFFGGVKGFTAIDPRKVMSSFAPFPVFVYKVEYLSGTTTTELRELQWDKIIMPAGTNKISIYLAALTFNTNHKIKFSYKIDGIQNEYTNIDDNILTLNTLNYGYYKIRFRYRKEDGSFVEDALTLSVYINPQWYQTWWFKTLVFLAVAGLVYALYRYRISQIKKQHEIRKNIATDLHDDLGSTLNSVKILTNLAISGVKQQESLLQIKNNLNEATTGLRDMIWVLDDSQDTVEQLITRLRQFAYPVAQASGIDAQITCSPEVGNYTLRKEEKRNLFLINKEAINNSIKYSAATKIKLHIEPSGKKIRITIADNGKGFNPATVTKGYGLKNMQYRAGQVGYKVNIVSVENTGTTIYVLAV